MMPINLVTCDDLIELFTIGTLLPKKTFYLHSSGYNAFDVASVLNNTFNICIDGFFYSPKVQKS